MADIYISIGSNIKRETHIRQGVNALRDHFGELVVSRIFESEAVGFDGDPFYNLVVRASTDSSIEEVVMVLHEIEDRFGRTRSGPRFSSRTLDMDLLLYDDVVSSGGVCQLPRDEISHNAFVLWPLSEIAPELKHPLLQKSYADLWGEFDRSGQRLEPIDFKW